MPEALKGGKKNVSKKYPNQSDKKGEKTSSNITDTNQEILRLAQDDSIY